MSEAIPVKLLLKQLDHPPEEHLFEQETIKVGRGRTGKARKGVDLQLKDPDVARVHAVLQVRGENDVQVMPMGTAATYINGSKVKYKDKLENGTVIEMGTSQITVYLGEAAAHSYLDESGAIVESAAPQAEIPIQSGEYEVMEEGGLSAPAPGVEAGEGWAESAVAGAPDTLPPASQAPGAAPATTPGVSQASELPAGAPSFSDLAAGGQEHTLYPMHTEPEGTFGPMGPTPPPLPETYPASSLPMLLDVMDRLGKEVWYRQEKLW